MTTNNPTLPQMMTYIYGDRLYVLEDQTNVRSELIAVDLSGGKAVYRGQLTVNGTAQEQREWLGGLKIFNLKLTA